MTDQTNNDRRPLSVVMPVYNEERTINAIVTKVLRIAYLRELVIVDDCSNDGTPQLATALAAQDSRIRYVRMQRNVGKTHALSAGFAMTVGDIVIVQDADLEYDPTEISEVIQPIVDGHADVVYGSRFLVRKAARVLNFHHFLGNKFLTFLSDAFTNLNLTDVETCYKAFRGQIIRNMILTSSGFGFEIEVTAKVAKLGCRVYETPISYYGRTYAEGKKIGARDGFAALWYIIRYNLFTSLRSSYRTMPHLSSSNGSI